eukprot:CAMPEP_0197002888 /NCGR_PEP_ID=MMETSP1380-20130617/7283_1 /TAXON_ID=5936 /ORGANISM="Euplotes crassus, Strain CT5" /LENGTH=133 /DNA_ID=CAMNT_0042421201 /DNA_START=297 /DNA_END=698 /DNA_ORIENTATION=-
MNNNRNTQREISMHNKAKTTFSIKKEIKTLRARKWHEYYSEKKKALSKAVSLDRENVSRVPDHTEAAEMLPAFLRYKKALMERRILTEMNMKAKTEWSQGSLFEQLRADRNERKRKMHHEIWRRAIVNKARNH